MSHKLKNYWIIVFYILNWNSSAGSYKCGLYFKAQFKWRSQKKKKKRKKARDEFSSCPWLQKNVLKKYRVTIQNGCIKSDDGADKAERIPMHNSEDRMKCAWVQDLKCWYLGSWHCWPIIGVCNIEFIFHAPYLIVSVTSKFSGSCPQITHSRCLQAKVKCAFYIPETEET